MLAIQSGIAKYHCLYTQGAEASQTSGVFFDAPHPVFFCFRYRRSFCLRQRGFLSSVIDVHSAPLLSDVHFSSLSKQNLHRVSRSIQSFEFNKRIAVNFENQRIQFGFMDKCGLR